ncbi:MAG: D-alanyl-D-alanine carboxypeptidase/D-alanyl-D-alanine-endopeptidase [Geminicoccaceae bacterium]
MLKTGFLASVALALLAAGIGRADATDGASGRCSQDLEEFPAAMRAVMRKPAYQDAVWGLRAVDLDRGRTLLDVNPDCRFYIASVRKVFSVGELLNEVGPEHRYDTPIHRRGAVSKSGVLNGDLILVASGDLTMGGRTNPDGSIAIGNLDHNEANSLGNSDLTKPDPLAGYRSLARQVARAGIRRVTGEVIIDDRLFRPYLFRDEFELRPIFVNDDVVDVAIRPTKAGEPAAVEVRPLSSALRVKTPIKTRQRGSTLALSVDPDLPQCIGKPGCSATVAGSVPIDLVPPLTGRFPLVRTVRIVEPANYARTVLIELLRENGVRVDASAVRRNPVSLLPRQRHYPADTKVAELKGLPYADSAKLVLKVSYNIGADASLLLFGLTQGVDNMDAALAKERRVLASRYGIGAAQYHFPDGSGGGESRALNRAVTRMLSVMSRSTAFPAYLDSMPILGVDGSLAAVTDFQSDPTLERATGQVRAKTGTYVDETGTVLKAQALGGYVTTRAGRRLAFQLVVNNVPISGIDDVVQVFQDQGRVSAILWRDH